MNQESMPGPVAMASHTSSGVAASSASSRTSTSRPISALLRTVGGPMWLRRGIGRGIGQRLGLGRARHGQRVDSDDEAVVAPPLGALVVVLRDQRGDGRGELLGESGTV